MSTCSSCFYIIMSCHYSFTNVARGQFNSAYRKNYLCHKCQLLHPFPSTWVYGEYFNTRIRNILSWNHDLPHFICNCYTIFDLFNYNIICKTIINKMFKRILLQIVNQYIQRHHKRKIRVSKGLWEYHLNTTTIYYVFTSKHLFSKEGTSLWKKK